MDTIYADYSISMSEFKKNPAQVLRTAGEKPVAVLNHNRPAFYMVTPKLFRPSRWILTKSEAAQVTPKYRLKFLPSCASRVAGCSMRKTAATRFLSDDSSLSL